MSAKKAKKSRPTSPPTPLEMAAMAGDIKTANELIRQGATDSTGKALAMAAATDVEEMVKLLLPVSDIMSAAAAGALFSAAKEGRINIMRLLAPAAKFATIENATEYPAMIRQLRAASSALKDHADDSARQQHDFQVTSSLTQALLVALDAGFTESARLLVPVVGPAAMRSAARAGKLNVVTAIIDLAATDQKVSLAALGLHEAAAAGHLPIIEAVHPKCEDLAALLAEFGDQFQPSTRRYLQAQSDQRALRAMSQNHAAEPADATESLAPPRSRM